MKISLKKQKDYALDGPMTATVNVEPGARASETVRGDVYVTMPGSFVEAEDAFALSDFFLALGHKLDAKDVKAGAPDLVAE
jgi:hypothetical protein